MFCAQEDDPLLYHHSMLSDETINYYLTECSQSYSKYLAAILKTILPTEIKSGAKLQTTHTLGM